MKQLLADLAFGVSMRELKYFLIQLLVAIVLTQFILFLGKRKNNITVSASELYILSACVTFLTVLSRYQLPVAVISGAIILAALYLKRNSNQTLSSADGWLLCACLSLCVGIGSGYVLLTILFCLVIILPALFISNK